MELNFLQITDRRLQNDSLSANFHECICQAYYGVLYWRGATGTNLFVHYLSTTLRKTLIKAILIPYPNPRGWKILLLGNILERKKALVGEENFFPIAFFPKTNCQKYLDKQENQMRSGAFSFCCLFKFFMKSYVCW